MSHVYFIKPVGADGPIKIGHSIHPTRRLASLKPASPLPLEIICTAPGGVVDETRLHRQFEGHRLHFEWFSPAPELLMLIAVVRETGALPDTGEPAPAGLAPVTDIFRAFGGATEVAKAVNAPLTTVCSWRTQNKRGIPTYRRPAVLSAIESLGKDVHPDTIEYLKAAARQQAAA